MLTMLLMLHAHAAEDFGGHTFYLGDLHAHTGASRDGGAADVEHGGADCHACGAIGDAAGIARENGLDFYSLTDHANGHHAARVEDFERVIDATLAAHDPERGVVTVPGVELWFRSGDETPSHKNLYFFGSNSDLDGLTLKDVQFSGPGDHIGDCEAIWEFVERVEASFGRALLIPHHPGLRSMSTDWDCHLAEGAETFSPAVEVYSEHGNSTASATPFDPLWLGEELESMVHAALDPEGYGLRLGFLGGTDSHDTQPGSVCALDAVHTEHPYGGGLTVAVLPADENFDRPALYEAVTTRRTYATSGPLVPALMTIYEDGEAVGTMGEVVRVEPGARVEVVLDLPLEWDSTVVEVQAKVSGGELAASRVAPGTWSVTLQEPVRLGYVALEVLLEGQDAHPVGCEDGGSTSTEYLWLSPAWFEVADGTVSQADPSDTGDVVLDEPMPAEGGGGAPFRGTGCAHGQGPVGWWALGTLLLLPLRRRSAPPG